MSLNELKKSRTSLSVVEKGRPLILTHVDAPVPPFTPTALLLDPMLGFSHPDASPLRPEEYLRKALQRPPTPHAYACIH